VTCLTPFFIFNTSLTIVRTSFACSFKIIKIESRKTSWKAVVTSQNQRRIAGSAVLVVVRTSFACSSTWWTLTWRTNIFIKWEKETRITEKAVIFIWSNALCAVCCTVLAGVICVFVLVLFASCYLLADSSIETVPIETVLAYSSILAIPAFIDFTFWAHICLGI